MLKALPDGGLLRVRLVAAAVAASLASGLAIATITALYANPFFGRMTPVRTQDWGFLIATSVLTGVLAATYLLPAVPSRCEKRVAGGGLLNVLAIGCPICNKVVVLLLGVSGALTYWAPIQPLLAVGGLLLLLWALRLRLRAVGVAPSAPTA